MPMFPAAPGRFSTMTCCPSALVISGDISRAMVSFDPPGAKGTIARIRRSGYSAPAAQTGKADASRTADPRAEHASRDARVAHFENLAVS